MYISSCDGCGYTGIVCAISTTNLSVCKEGSYEFNYEFYFEIIGELIAVITFFNRTQKLKVYHSPDVVWSEYN